jgi:hypothetical protein
MWYSLVEAADESLLANDLYARVRVCVCVAALFITYSVHAMCHIWEYYFLT